MSGFTVQSAINYRVNLFNIPGKEYVAYAIDYKVIKSPCYNQSLLNAYCHD